MLFFYIIIIFALEHCLFFILLYIYIFFGIQFKFCQATDEIGVGCEEHVPFPGLIYRLLGSQLIGKQIRPLHRVIFLLPIQGCSKPPLLFSKPLDVNYGDILTSCKSVRKKSSVFGFFQLCFMWKLFV